MVATTHSARHEVKYSGSPTTAAARSAALARDGPLVLAKEHLLAAIMPNALERDATSGAVSITSLDMNALALSGMVWAQDAASAGLHGAVPPAEDTRAHRERFLVWTTLM